MIEDVFNGKMRIRMLVILLVALLMLLPTLPAQASTEANVTITATGAFLNIEVTPTTYDFGVIDAGITVDTIQQAFSINNSSSVTIHLLIQAAAWTSAGTAWTYGAAAFNQGRFLASDGDNAFDVTIVASATSYNLTDNLGASTNRTFEMRLQAPTGFQDGSQNSSNITLIAYRA